MTAPLPDDEAARLDAVGRYKILDTAPEEAFNEVVQSAARICQTPTALITFIDRDRQWIKARVGSDLSEIKRGVSLCAHTILQPDVLVVPDMRSDLRFADNPLVVAEPYARFYAGAPLITPEGYALGTLCVIDDAPRTITPEQREMLLALGRQVISQLQLRRYVTSLEHAIKLLAVKDAAEEANHAKSLFLTNMSYELRTALNAIIGFSELLQDQAPGALNARQVSYVNHILTSGQRLRQLLGDIFDLTKTEGRVHRRIAR